MNSISTKKLALNGVMIAVVFLTTYFTKIPGPVGPFNIGDAAIMLTAVLLGRNSGFLSGAIGSAIADIAMGYGIFAPFTFIVKGIEGYVVGVLASKNAEGKTSEAMRIVAIATGAIIMISGYFLAETFLLRFIDPAFGLAKALEDLPFNLVQGGVSAVIGYVVSILLIKANVYRFIKE